MTYTITEAQRQLVLDCVAAGYMGSYYTKFAEAHDMLQSLEPVKGEPVAELMLDPETMARYMQYTIPLSILPIGAKLYTHPQRELSDEEIEAVAQPILDRGHGWEGLQPWVFVFARAVLEKARNG